MIKPYSISLHNGTKWSRQHNIRGAGLDEQDYNHFQEVRHDPDLFGKESKSKEKPINVNRDFER